ncbi:MAG: UPF0158 family protein [Ginsengibacter sp.]
MKQLSKRDRFYYEVGEAMAMNNMRCFIKTDTLEVEIHAGEDAFFLEEEEDTAKDALNNPAKFLPLEAVSPHESFKIMEGYIDTVKDTRLQAVLIQALERKRPFANFKNIVDNSPLRQQWFDYHDDAYTQLAKEWIEENAGKELKEKIKGLPGDYITE